MIRFKKFLKYSCCIFLTILFFSPIYSQTINRINSDTLNKVDSLGRRTGYWIQYIKPNLGITKKKEKAVFYRFVRYINHCQIDFTGSPQYSKTKLSVKGNNIIKDSIVLMDGLYQLYRKNETLVWEVCYDKGKVQWYKLYYNTGSLLEYVDFTRKYNNDISSNYSAVYFKNGSLEFDSYSFLDKWKWKFKYLNIYDSKVRKLIPQK